MTDLSRDIGGLEARMDEHEKRLDRIEHSVKEGFGGVNARLDDLSSAENRRKGMMTLIKIAFGASGIAGAWEILKSFAHK